MWAYMLEDQSFAFHLLQLIKESTECNQKSIEIGVIMIGVEDESSFSSLSRMQIISSFNLA